MAKYGLQTAFINRVLQESFAGQARETLPEHLYLALGLNQEGADANTEDFDEVVADSYARAPVVFGEAADGTISNTSNIIFNTAAEIWTTGSRTIDMVGLYTALTDGELLAVLRLPKSETVEIGDTIILAINALQLSLSDI